jgi:hypothetical protein
MRSGDNGQNILSITERRSFDPFSDCAIGRSTGPHLDPSEISQLALIQKKKKKIFKIFLYIFKVCKANLLRGVVKCTSATGPNGDPWIALHCAMRLID